MNCICHHKFLTDISYQSEVIEVTVLRYKNYCEGKFHTFKTNQQMPKVISVKIVDAGSDKPVFFSNPFMEPMTFGLLIWAL